MNYRTKIVIFTMYKYLAFYYTHMLASWYEILHVQAIYYI
jgi:hypothetical protein